MKTDSPSPEPEVTKSAIIRHIEKHIGKIDSVWHELVPLGGHIDIHIVKPTESTPHYTLITSGMSDFKMTPFSGASEGNHIELVLCLPPDWTPTNEALTDEKNHWPIRLLKSLARMPRENGTWLWLGHSVPNTAPCDVPSPFVGTLISWATNVAEEFETLKISEEKEICFFAVLPLFKEEMEYKLSNGSVKLMKMFEEQKIPLTIDTKRRNLAKKPWWNLFG